MWISILACRMLNMKGWTLFESSLFVCATSSLSQNAHSPCTKRVMKSDMNISDQTVMMPNQTGTRRGEACEENENWKHA